MLSYLKNCYAVIFNSSCDGRVVKALDSKSNGVSPRRFKSCSQRLFLESLFKRSRYFSTFSITLFTRGVISRLPHTSRFFCRRATACRTLADYLSRLTAFRLDFSFDLRHVGKNACSRDSHDNFSLVRYARSPTNCLGPPQTSRQSPTRRFETASTVRYRPTSPDLVAYLSTFTSRQVKIFCRPTKNRLVCGSL